MCVKNFAVICLPLSLRSVLGGPYLNTQCVVNACAKSHTLTRLNGTVTVSFVNRSIMTSSLALSAAQAAQSCKIACPDIGGLWARFSSRSLRLAEMTTCGLLFRTRNMNCVAESFVNNRVLPLSMSVATFRQNESVACAVNISSTDMVGSG
eukprot:IDg16251t1